MGIGIGIHMVSKNISLSEKAYEILSKLKRPNESFSEAILRLATRNANPMDYVGSWEDMDEKTFATLKKHVTHAHTLLSDHFRSVSGDSS